MPGATPPSLPCRGCNPLKKGEELHPLLTIPSLTRRGQRGGAFRGWKGHRGRSLRALCLMLILAGCAWFKPAPAKPVKTGEPPPIRALRAEAVMEFKEGAGSRSGRASIVVNAPASFRIEILGPFNSPVTAIVSDGTVLSIFSDGALKTYRWDEENPVLPYAFTSEELAALLLGGGRLAPGAAPLSTGYRTTSDKDGNITGVVKVKDGTEVFMAVMSDFRSAGEGVFPFSITVDDGYKSLRVRYSAIEINPDIKPDVFNIAAPP